MISYDRFWATLKSKNITQYALIKKHGFSTALLNRLRHNEPISMATADYICNLIECRIEDIVEILPDKK